MFILKADLHTKILPEELTEITRNDDTLVLTACAAAESEMRTYLFDVFDVVTIFANTGANRHALLLDMCVDVALYLLVARTQGGQDVSDRQARYDRAVKWAKVASRTENYNDLPRRENTAQDHFLYGSNPKRKNYY
jgi:phage gp36-like protein